MTIDAGFSITMTTNELKQFTKNYLNAHGYRVDIVNVGQRGRAHTGPRKGTADLIGQAPRKWGGVFTAVEVKNRETGDTPTQAQLDYLADVRERGGIAFIVRCPEDLDKECP